ncbi:MAG: hypothetical protein PHT62_04135 [Desulfotomaculaceae bacterium]|nr:hypothetical protein [Desulfotomaculaceae bacterium]
MFITKGLSALYRDSVARNAARLAVRLENRLELFRPDRPVA